MKKLLPLTLVSLFATSCAWLARNPSSALSEANMVTLTGDNAQGMREVLQKVDGLESQENPCEGGSCYEQGAVQVACHHSVEKKASRAIYCTVNALNKEVPKLELEGNTASSLSTIVTRASGGAKKFSCEKNHCQLHGELYISCAIPNGSTEVTCALQDNSIL